MNSTLKLDAARNDVIGTTVEESSQAAMTINIPDVPPSLNQYLRMHWARRRSLKDSWMAQIAVRARIAGWNMKPVDFAVRGIVTLYNSRIYDKDNAYGACKVIFDSLKTLGLIVDDRKEWFDLNVRQEKCRRKEKHTIIELERV